jgi:protein tyrosine/serine phosphatase
LVAVNPKYSCHALGVNRTPQWIVLDGAVNARAVVPRVLLRSDNLQSLSARDVRHLVDEHALEVVVDLRTDVEATFDGAGAIGDERGLRVEPRSLYPDSPGDVQFDRSAVKPWEMRYGDDYLDEPAVVRAYMSYLRMRPDSIVGSVRAVACADGAVLVHCAAGKDRTGVVVAIALDAAGVERDMIVADYLATAERIDAIIARLARSPLYSEQLERSDPQQHAPLPGTIERVLELLDERYGGSAAWLLENGLGEDDLQRLRRRLFR